MSNDKLQDKYNEIFREIKEDKMNWDFDDFLIKTEDQQTDEKIVPLKTNDSKPSFLKFFWMAASIALILGLFLLYKNFIKTDIQTKNEMVKNEILKQKNEENNDFLVQNTSAENNQDSLKIREKDSMVQSIKSDEEAQEVMNRILPARGRIKRTVKQRYAAAEPVQTKKDIKPASAKTKNQNINQSSDYQDSFVIINGQKIENEEEAIDVAKYSLQMLSNQVSKTVAKADPLTNYNE